jgi:hypothetical protein
MSTKTYLVLMEEDGLGCDYTIGCGKQWKCKDFSDDIEEALEQATKWATEWYGDRVSEVWLVADDDVHEADVEGYKAREEERKNRKKAADKEARERAQLERLKKKYEEQP